MENILFNIQKLGWRISEEEFNSWTDYERKYFIHEFSDPWSPESYRQRLEKIGFDGVGSTLDIGCGMGQWSLALATMNDCVIGIDINKDRLRVAKSICNSSELNNVKFLSCSAENLPFTNESFDAIFCYSMIMFVPIDKVLSEFRRVLKSAGKLYINVDSNGYYLHLLLVSLFSKRDFKMAYTCIRFIARGYFGKKICAAISPRRLERIIMKAGYEVVAIAPEGRIQVKQNLKTNSKYQHKFLGLSFVTEALAVKI
jgi:ubiquinone/menaquinone biosynthesis C-methylase UbiE